MPLRQPFSMASCLSSSSSARKKALPSKQQEVWNNVAKSSCNSAWKSGPVQTSVSWFIAKTKVRGRRTGHPRSFGSQVMVFSNILCGKLIFKLSSRCLTVHSWNTQSLSATCYSMPQIQKGRALMSPSPRCKPRADHPTHVVPAMLPRVRRRPSAPACSIGGWTGHCCL